MTDGEDEDSGVPRRHFLYLGGTTAAAATGATLWGWPHFKKILAGRDEPGNFGDRDGDDSPGTETPPTTDSEYDALNEYLSQGCSLSDREWDAVRGEVDNYDQLEGDSIAGYLENGRVDLRKQDTELELLIDAEGDGQYDHQDLNIEDAC